MAPRQPHLDPAAAGLLLVLCAIWGGGQVAIKIASTGISPLVQAGLRSAGAALLLWGWSAFRGIRLLERDGRGGYGLAIATLFTLEFVCIYWGFTFTTASRGVLFIYAAPFVVALGAHFLLPQEPLGPAKVAGLACAFGGLGLAFAGLVHGFFLRWLRAENDDPATAEDIPLVVDFLFAGLRATAKRE